MPIISASLLSANFANLKEEIKRIRNTDMIHIDVMDGVFVPDITFGQKIMWSIKDILKELNLKILLDTHLMIINPINHINTFYEAGADIITFHYEAYRNIEKCIEVIKDIKNLGIKAGIAINPETYLPKEELNILLTEGKPDILLIMSVHPGFSGQEFIPDVFNKIKEMRNVVNGINESNLKENLKMKIAADGGIKLTNAKKIIENGADILTAGSEIFKGDSYELIENFKNLK
ncbi:MAG: ribulose-phosphate 3-epimerase [Candidatus Altiarchaeales archaeon A3]|nr:MAG: ribulose-phosphate 3-epimerase [Candidatus Altiarchaeales archaeon A3]